MAQQENLLDGSFTDLAKGGAKVEQAVHDSTNLDDFEKVDADQLHSSAFPSSFPDPVKDVKETVSAVQNIMDNTSEVDNIGGVSAGTMDKISSDVKDVSSEFSAELGNSSADVEHLIVGIKGCIDDSVENDLSDAMKTTELVCDKSSDLNKVATEVSNIVDVPSVTGGIDAHPPPMFGSEDIESSKQHSLPPSIIAPDILLGSSSEMPQSLDSFKQIEVDVGRAEMKQEESCTPLEKYDLVGDVNAQTNRYSEEYHNDEFVRGEELQKDMITKESSIHTVEQITSVSESTLLSNEPSIPAVEKSPATYEPVSATWEPAPTHEATPPPRDPTPSPREPTPPPKQPTPTPREPTPPQKQPTPTPREPTPPPREPTPPPREPTPPRREPTPPPREPTPPPRESTPPPRKPTPPPMAPIRREPSPVPREPTPPPIHQTRVIPTVSVEFQSSKVVEPLHGSSYPAMDDATRATLAIFNPRAWFHPEQLDPRVAELIYWRDVKKSGASLGSILVLLFSLTVFSLISVLAYSALTVLLGAVAFRIYKNVKQAVQKTQDGHPFKEYLAMSPELPASNVHGAVDVFLGQVNSSLAYLHRIFLVEDLIDSCKFGCYLWVLTYVGAWVNGLTLIILSVIALFSLPKAYEQNKAQVDQYMGLAQQQVNQVLEKIKAVLPIGGNKDKEQ